MSKQTLTALVDILVTILLGFVASWVGPVWYPLVAAVVVAIQGLVLALLIHWLKLELKAMFAQFKQEVLASLRAKG